MNMCEFLKLQQPEMFDFTDTNPISGYAQKHGIDKYILYKLSADIKDPDTSCDDPDSSNQFLRCIYKQLWKENLPDCSDTMNSVQTTFNRLLACYNNEEKIYKRSASLKYIVDLYYKNELDKEHIHDVEALMNVYHTIGNYMPVPEGVNNWKNSMFKDYFDLFLSFIYEYYNVNTNLKKWLDKFDNWDDFINKNYLMPFVNINDKVGYAEPKELWEGHFRGAILPETTEQCNAYFKNASEWILARGKLMVEELKKEVNKKANESSEA